MKSSLRLAISLAVAALLLAVLMAVGGVGPAEMLSGLRRLSLTTYLAALALQAGIGFLRALRFRLLLPRPRPGLGRMFWITSAYTLAAQVLPAKVGEASFVVYANRTAAVPAAMGAASLLVSRLLDVATLALGVAIACIALSATGSYPHAPWLGPLGLSLVPIALVLFVASARGDLLLRAAAGVTRLLGLGRSRLGVRLLAAGDRVARAVRTAGSRRTFAGASALSLAAWLCVFVYCAVLARGLGLPADTTFAEATFGSGIAVATSLVPISAFANFGTLEAGWVAGFQVVGVEADLAYATGIGLHIVQIANVVLLGVLGHVGMALAAPVRDEPR